MEEIVWLWRKEAHGIHVGFAYLIHSWHEASFISINYIFLSRDIDSGLGAIIGMESSLHSH